MDLTPVYKQFLVTGDREQETGYREDKDDEIRFSAF
jgi:hypothetical protein